MCGAKVLPLHPASLVGDGAALGPDERPACNDRFPPIILFEIYIVVFLGGTRDVRPLLPVYALLRGHLHLRAAERGGGGRGAVQLAGWKNNNKAIFCDTLTRVRIFVEIWPFG